MSTQSEKSIQELRDEITRLENTIAQQREIIKFRGDELNKRSPEALDALRRELSEALDGREAQLQRAVQLRRQIEACVGSVLNYGPRIENIEDCLPLVTLRVKALEEQAQELRQIPVDKRELEALKKERDATMMRALNAERDLQRERDRSANLKKYIDELQISEEIVKLRQGKDYAEADAANKEQKIKEMTQQYVRTEYGLRDARRELSEIKQSYTGLKEVEAHREWATTNQNAYFALMALRAQIVPNSPLGEAREAILQRHHDLTAGMLLVEQKAQCLQNELQTAKAEWSHERAQKEGFYRLYGELQKLFHMETISHNDPSQVHAAIKHLLDTKTRELENISACLQRERELSCAEIRKLQALARDLQAIINKGVLE